MMSNKNQDLDEHLAGLLNRLVKVSPLNPQDIAEERAKFLMQAASFRAAASPLPDQPKAGWFSALGLALRGKQQRAFSNLLVALVLTVALVLGSTGFTVYAAQQSLPDEFLYPVKMMSEDARLALTISSQSQLELMLGFSNQRFEEIAALRILGKPVPEVTITRMHEQLDSALRIAAEMNDPELVQALAQIRQRAETQAEQMSALMGEDANAVDPVLEQLQMRLEEQVQYAAEGETDPEGFRQLVQAWERERWRPTPAMNQLGTTPNAESQNGNSENGNQPVGTPGQSGPGTPGYTHPPIQKNNSSDSGSGEGGSSGESGPEPTPVPAPVEELPRPQERP